ncbi:hypothetical protein AX774_g6097 [Zancudomyces culisetae]|uniref:Uncharacterized protein n=1 Tax=Zancudomyces culisetae TaxID=1213189 RepID=A0A1R1PHP3_ZANCU|nr:hypothetical protein AX774_g6097 [Zancudomyces culisetae]|eukprot:OMH80468.1 hypothetical protein AX774_g6097 [Zancudomyces culisetae]
MPNFERIQDNLTSFNKSFGFYLQGLKIQSKTLDFPGIPTEDSTTLVGENTETLKPRNETGKPGMNSGSTLEESLGAYNADDTIHSPLHTVDSGDNSPQKAGVNERSINVSPRTIKNQSGAMGTKNRINDGMRDIGRGVAMGVEKNLPTPRRHATGIGPKSICSWSRQQSAERVVSFWHKTCIQSSEKKDGI